MDTPEKYYCHRCGQYRRDEEAIPVSQFGDFQCLHCEAILLLPGDPAFPPSFTAAGTLADANREYLIEQIMALVEMGIETYGDHLDAGATVEEAIIRSLADAREDVREWVASFALKNPCQEEKV